jgi:hypothetical protein
MTKRSAAGTKPSSAKWEMTIAEATVVDTNDAGDILIDGPGRVRWARSTILALVVEAGDGVLVTTAADGQSFVLGISRPSKPSDDVVLRSPRGRLVLEAATDLELRARDGVRAEAPNLEVTADSASLHVREASIVADVIRTTADEIATAVGRWELGARRIVERAVDVIRAYEGVLHLTTGRSHTVVREAYDLVAKRTSIASEEDTTIDGKRVLLG